LIADRLRVSFQPFNHKSNVLTAKPLLATNLLDFVSREISKVGVFAMLLLVRVNGHCKLLAGRVQ